MNHLTPRKAREVVVGLGNLVRHSPITVGVPKSGISPAFSLQWLHSKTSVHRHYFFSKKNQYKNASNKIWFTKKNKIQLGKGTFKIYDNK